MMIFPFACSPCVAQRIVASDDEPGVIAPLIRITDTDAQRLELSFSLFLCRGRHPTQGIDAMFEGSAQVVHNLLHLSLGRRREIFRDIDFADSVAEIGVDVGDSALPTVELFGCSLKRLIIEAKSQIVVGLREKGG